MRAALLRCAPLIERQRLDNVFAQQLQQVEKALPAPVARVEPAEKPRPYPARILSAVDVVSPVDF